jgi:hypothetical protein
MTEGEFRVLQLTRYHDLSPYRSCCRYDTISGSAVVVTATSAAGGGIAQLVQVSEVQLPTGDHLLSERLDARPACRQHQRT